MGAVENQRTVYHRSHRPWKSLQDFHTPAARRLFIHNQTHTGRGVTHLSPYPVSQLRGAVHLVSGHLERKVPITNFLLGSRLRMTGICRIVAGGPWRTPSSFHIEMRNAADVQLIARPSWWTVQHLLELLAALLSVAIAIAAWAILLGRRVAQQSARINRSMKISRERSRILEMIVSNQSPEVLLTEICDSVMALVPEAACWYRLDPEGEPPANGFGAADDRQNNIDYQVQLTGPDEQTMGSIFVSDAKSRICPSDRQEVYAM